MNDAGPDLDGSCIRKLLEMEVAGTEVDVSVQGLDCAIGVLSRDLAPEMRLVPVKNFCTQLGRVNQAGVRSEASLRTACYTECVSEVSLVRQRSHRVTFASHAVYIMPIVCEHHQSSPRERVNHYGTSVHDRIPGFRTRQAQSCKPLDENCQQDDQLMSHADLVDAMSSTAAKVFGRIHPP